jgi:crotonobetainyl-CoA:carnitine CoA-transferase CaiB-like acyl-CoA transferase
VNRNKKSIKLDLKQAEGKEVFRKLVEQTDVLLEGFRPGVMDKLELGFEELREINPRLIYCAITGYGQDGPYRNAVGHDVNYLSYAGISGLTGELGGKPVLSDIQVADIGGGALMGVIGILMALQARAITGKGQMCDVSMMDGVVSWLPFILGRFAAGEEPSRGSSLLGGGYACYHIYPTLDGKYVSIGALEDKFWIEFCRRIGREELVAQQMDIEAQPMVIRELNEIFRQKTQEEWIGFFDGADICFSPVNDLHQAVRDPQILHRKMIVDVEIENRKNLLIGIPIKLSETPGEIRTTFPNHGEHTSEIMMKLGYSKKEIEAMAAKSIV